MRLKAKKIFLSGICGTGMASLACMLKETGFDVSGSDTAVYPPMSTFLKEKQVQVYEGFNADNLKSFTPDLVVIGNALSRGNEEVEYALDEGIPLSSLAEVLKEYFIRDKRSIVVTGTHGKTTTTAMLAWILDSAGKKPSFMAGGIAENFASSYSLGDGADFVVEGDEYDTAFFDKSPKFLHYLPRIALIKNIEFDHADIYADLEAIKVSFKRLINIVPRSGLIVGGTDSGPVADLLSLAHSRVATFGLNTGSWRAQNISIGKGVTEFDVHFEGNFWHRFHSPMIGDFNVLNALSTVVVAAELGLSPEEIDRGLRTFRSVKRRLELRGDVAGVKVYDDFAHHPTAVGETLKGVRAQFPEHKIWAVFEPRSQTSRRSVFEAEFSQALSIADIAILSSVFSAQGIDAGHVFSPERVLKLIEANKGVAHCFDSTDEIVKFISENAKGKDVVVVMSNGSFDDIHERLIQKLRGQG